VRADVLSVFYPSTAKSGFSARLARVFPDDHEFDEGESCTLWG